MIEAVLLAAIAIFLALMSAAAYRQPHRNSISPSNVFLASAALFYLLDVAFSVLNYSHHFKLSGLSFPYEVELAAKASIYYMSVTAVMYLILQTNESSQLRHIAARIERLGAQLPLRLLLKLSSAATIACFLVLFFQIQKFGLAAYFSNMAIRGQIFSETTFQNAMVSLTISTHTLLSALFHTYHRRWSTTALLIMPLISLAILTGARAAIIEIVFLFAFILGLSGHRLKLGLRGILILALSAFALVEFAGRTRVHSDGDLTSPVAKVFQSEQVPQSENGMNLIRRPLEVSTNTIFQSGLSFLPRNLLDNIGIEKGHGGNAVYTGAFVPYRWHDQKSQLSLGGLNELLMNFGIFGAVLAASIIGILVKIAIFACSRHSYLVLLSPALTWSLFQFLRGDSFHTLNKLAIFGFSIAMIMISVHLKSALKGRS